MAGDPCVLFPWQACTVSSLDAQHMLQRGSNRPSALTFRSSTNLVLVDVIALNARTGAPDKTLKQEEFRIFDNGRNVPIRTFDRELQSRPLALWLVVQCNMPDWEKQGSGLFAGREHLFEPALKSLDKRDTVAVAHFCDDGQSQLDLLPTSDTGQALSSLRRVLAAVHQISSHGREGELALQKTLELIVDATSRSSAHSVPAIVFLFGDYSAMPKSEADHFINELLATSVIAYGIRDSESPQIRELT